MCVIVAFVPYYAQMQTLRKIDIAENVEEIKLICILASINNCPIYNQPEFCHHEASGLATISVFPLGVRNMGAFPYPKSCLQKFVFAAPQLPSTGPNLLDERLRFSSASGGW